MIEEMSMRAMRNSFLSVIAFLAGLTLVPIAQAATPAQKSATPPPAAASPSAGSPSAAPAAAPEKKSTATPASAARSSETETSYAERGPVVWLINDKRAQHTENQLSIMGEIWPFGTFNAGVGAWFAIPVVPHGFVPTINNSVDVEFGAFFQYFHLSASYLNISISQNWYRLSPMGGVRWNFYLNRDWTVYAGAKLGYGIGFSSSVTANVGGVPTGYAGSDVSAFLFDMNAGALWHVSKAVALRMELGIFGFTIGATLPM